MLSFGTLDTDGGFQAVTRTMKIVNIEPADHGYSLTLKDYNPALYEYGKLPEYKSNITYIPDGNPKPHTSDKGYVTREELKKVNEQAVKQAALEAAAKAAQAAIDVISRGDTFSDVFQLNGYGTSLENLIDKMDEDARNAKDGLSITKDEILLKVSDTEEGLQSYIGITKKEILAKADDMRRELTALLNVQAGAIHALVKGGGATGQMALTLNLLVMIDEATREKLIKASSLEKVNAVYAKVKDTDYYGIKGNAGDAIKPLWEDARRAALLASQISLEADQIQFKSDNIFVNGKLKADYIDVLELAVKKTFTEKLVVNNSFIKKLATQDAFLDNLVAKKLKIDNDEQNPNDFEVAINNDIGILAKNNGHEIFRIKKSGEAFLNDAELKNVTVTGKITPNRGLLNTWYWGKMANTNQYEWFNVFKDRIDVGERLNIFGGGCFYNQKKGGWQYAIAVFIERLSEDVFELNGYPMYNQGGYLTQATFQKNSDQAFASSFYIGW